MKADRKMTGLRRLTQVLRSPFAHCCNLDVQQHSSDISAASFLISLISDWVMEWQIVLFSSTERSPGSSFRNSEHSSVDKTANSSKTLVWHNVFYFCFWGTFTDCFCLRNFTANSSQQAVLCLLGLRCGIFFQVHLTFTAEGIVICL